MRNRKEMRQNEDLSFCVCFIGGFLLGLFMTLEFHDCVDETDAAICE